MIFYWLNPSPILQKFRLMSFKAAGSINDLESNSQEGFLIWSLAFFQFIYLYSAHSVNITAASASIKALSVFSI